jgi:hypothetical protein
VSHEAWSASFSGRTVRLVVTDSKAIAVEVALFSFDLPDRTVLIEGVREAQRLAEK